ncbi:MAG: hypothetical protein PHR30_13005, partial [Gallionellaceae bacterium]|nr:hypothetical protein [Gallionellaceae bacterium]
MNGLTIGGAGTTAADTDLSTIAGGETVLSGGAYKSLNVTAVGAISQLGNLTADGAASFDGASVDLTTGGYTNDFGTLNFNSTGDVTITEAGDMNIVGNNTAKNLALTSTSGSIDAYYPSAYGTP